MNTSEWIAVIIGTTIGVTTSQIIWHFVYKKIKKRAIYEKKIDSPLGTGRKITDQVDINTRFPRMWDLIMKIQGYKKIAWQA